MARAFLKGASWGGGLSLGAVALLSVLSEPPRAPDVTIAAPAKGAAPQPALAETTQPKEDRVPVTGQQAPKAPAPSPDTLAAVDSDGLRPTAQPETGAPGALSEPGPTAEAASIVAGAKDNPVVPNARAEGLTTPDADMGATVSTAPAAPPQPALVTQPDVALAEQPSQPRAPALSGDVAALAPAEPALPGPDMSDDAISRDPTQPPAPAVPAETQAFGQASADVVTALPQEDALPPLPAEPDIDLSRRDVQSAAPKARAPAPSTETLPQETVAAPDLASEDVLAGVRTPAGGAGNIAPDVQINRLPGLREAPVASLTPGEASASQARPSDRPVDRFAVAFDNPDGKPAMAIVLMDDGVDLSQGKVGLPALRSFPYPISFAVDSTLPDAAARMAAYRAEGFEVLAMVDLPQAAQPQDAETSLAVALRAVPEAVGVLEGIGEGVQGSRQAALQVAEILAEKGHGFVTQNRGLNTVQKLAARSGVPSAVVFREFDVEGRSPAAMRRFLDQAAFRATQHGDVVMLGRLREETIAALLVWGLQDRATRVALAPISAVLTTQP